MKQSRQLAAIMFTDIQGYTALMQQNEEKAVQSREKHRTIFNATTKKYKGRILQYYGDGTLSIFDSAIDAVNCAIEMQQGFQQEPIVPVRIGIHTGDIIFSDEEIIGDGVNVASRIESLAVAGSVFISDKVYDEIKNQESIKTSLLKTFKLKNVERPIEVYAISNVGLIIPKPEELKGKADLEPLSLPENKKQPKSNIQKGVSLAIIIASIIALAIFVYMNFGTSSGLSTEKSIAVLAFQNMSGDPEQEYFSDGISEEILNSLVNVGGLKVAGRTSAFSFKGKNEDIRTIGDKLDVKMVLEGSVRKAGNQIRITAQLINVEDGFHLWSETYDREMKDIIAVQEDIANRIVEKLKLHVQETSKTKIGTQNMEAYELLLKGSYFLKRGFEGKKKAMGNFQKAVELDPDYAEAHAFIGETYQQYAGYNLMPSPEANAKARTAAQKAISLNKYEPRAHKVLAFIHLFYDWDWEATLSEYNKAIQYGLPHQNEFIIFYYILINEDFDRAIHISEQKIEADPLNIENYWQHGMCNYFAGRFEEALISLNNALELDPNFSEAHHWKGVILGHLGKFDQALSAVEKALEITKGQGMASINLLAVKILMGKGDEVEKTIKSMEFIDPIDPAMLYTLLGMYDQAIRWLEKAYRERSIAMVTLKHYWIWDPIRDDPRFIDIYKRMNFPE